MLLHDQAKAVVRRALNRLPLGGRGASERAHDWSDVRNYIPLEATLAAARQAGMPVGDYIDSVMNKNPGATQATLDRMAELGVFAEKIDTVVEIGPGTVRYLERTLRLCAPTRYEIYETAAPWASYLEKRFDIIL